MQIESLKVFCDLAETESFTKAAQINQVTQSAVSQQISSLERQFKSLLIERSKKKFRLTREGQVLYEYSKQIIQTFEALHSRLQEIKDIISGTIRVATIYSIGLHDLPPYIKRFLRAYPTVHVHVEYRRANQVYEDVLGNVVDLGLVAFPSKDARLEVILLRRDIMVLICHPQHPLAKLKTAKLGAITGQKFIAFEPDIPYVIAWVDLDEGPRLITNIVGCSVEGVKLGMKVAVAFEQASKDVWLPKFKPA